MWFLASFNLSQGYGIQCVTVITAYILIQWPGGGQWIAGPRESIVLLVCESRSWIPWCAEIGVDEQICPVIDGHLKW